MARPAAAQIITIGRSDQPQATPEETLDWHAARDEWWSSTRHHGRIWKGMIVFVRFVPGGEIIGRAQILDPDPVHFDEGPDAGLHWRWHEVKFLNEEPIRGVFLRDFDISGWRARPGLIALSTPERDAISRALDENAVSHA